MKILVLNGSPKGKYSITLQTILYLQKKYPSHDFEILHVGQRIKALEKDFSPVIQMIEQADLLLFSYPVYTFIAPSQLHRFIELLKEKKPNISGKFAAQLSTSKHFYDITAQRFIQDNAQDLGLKYITGLSADMDDLLTEKGQSDACSFFEFLCWSISNDHFTSFPAEQTVPAHIPVSVPNVQEDKCGDIVIITDCADTDTQLNSMIERFRAVCHRKTRVFNLRSFSFNGGCLGCFSCAVSGKCVHKDNFDEVLRNELQTAEAMVYAFSIRDHSMGALFKLYDDRQFCNGHRTVTMGMPVAYLISGNYHQEFNLQTIVEGRAQVGSNFLAGVATDETDPDREIDQLAATLEYALKHRYTPPQNFYGVGGMKIFRDLIWLMQGMMRADHKFYKAHGQYDFPQKNWPRMLSMYLVGAMLVSPYVKSKLGSKMTEGMLMPYKKLLDKQ